MKTTLIAAIAVLALAGSILPFVSTSANGASYADQAASTSYPIGKIVEVALVTWPLTTQRGETVRGTLLSISSEWVVVKDGSYENWVPREKVMTLRASR